MNNMIMMKNMMKMMIMKIIMNPQLKNLSQTRIIILPKGFQKTLNSLVRLAGLLQ